jgi:hypothetical protein
MLGYYLDKKPSNLENGKSVKKAIFINELMILLNCFQNKTEMEKSKSRISFTFLYAEINLKQDVKKLVQGSSNKSFVN